ncbi:Tn3 family transposase [Actinomadura formosensis]|uniref:Tn3 family transposase n=1 Tax=Actinomadura formosensis TaxID=60706 RepID=UPI003D8CFDE4
MPYDVLAWTQEWYVREDTLREANTVIVNYHHSLESSLSGGRRVKVMAVRASWRRVYVRGSLPHAASAWRGGEPALGVA